MTRRLILVLAVLAAALPAGARAEHFTCVGNPPRQTEDPLSPPCVPPYHGDNGGSTARGVSRDTIRVVLFNDLGVKGDLNQRWNPSDDGVAGSPGSASITRTIKAHLRYHLKAYETYGRTVRVFAIAAPTRSCSEDRSYADLTVSAFDPFAVLVLGTNRPCYTTRLGLKFDIPSFGLNIGATRAEYGSAKARVFGFFPDVEAQARIGASFLCRQLKGRPARFTSDPLLTGRTRSFGMIAPDASARSEGLGAAAGAMLASFAELCGGTFDVRRYDDSGTLAGWRESISTMADFKRRGVTTIVCFCMPTASELTVTGMRHAASAIGYAPEWYWDHSTTMDRSVSQSSDPAMDAGLGVSPFWRLQRITEQPHYQAYLHEEPGSEPSARWSFAAYTTVQMAFTAIQLAGPTLTSDTVAEGLSSFARRTLENPWLPSGGYDDTPLGSQTFIDSALAWWWDAKGTPPGGKPQQGCFRVAREGARATVGTWPESDADLFASGAPCTELQPWREEPTGVL